jgi:flagellin
MVINTNVSASNAAFQLGQSSNVLSKSLARLSSGSKITSPADDSAGLGVSMKLGAQISRTAATLNNLGNATSFAQTQDGYLQKIGDALNRMSELTVAAQDVTKTTSDRQIYNQEFQSLATYINDAVTKDFNGVSLFSGHALNVTTDSEGGSFQMTGISGNYGVSVGTVGVVASTTLGQLSPHLGDGKVFVTNTNHTGNPDYSHTFTSTDTLQDFVGFLNNTGGELGASYDSSTGELLLTFAPDSELAPQSGSHIFEELGLFPVAVPPSGARNMSSTDSATLSSLLTRSAAPDISTLDGAKSALTAIKSSISQLASDRATVGSNLTRLNYTGDQLSSLQNNLAAAKSRLTDVDVAQESTNYAKANILVQAGTAMLAQANATPQSVLKLLG